MRGTQRVGGLLRLFFGAAFVCAAWVLLSSTQADAAERPAPVELVVSVGEPTATSVATASPARAPGPKEPVAVVSGSAEPLGASVVEQLRTTTAAGVDVGAAGLKAVTATVPVLEATLVAVADEVVALVDAVPVVGRDAVVEVPLLGRPGTSVPAPLPETDGLVSETVADTVAKSVAKQQGPPSSTAVGVAQRGLALAAFDSDVRRTGMRSGPVSEPTPWGSGSPELPEPWPAPQSPMPPTQSAPSPGGGASSGDPASIDPVFLLPNPTAWGSSSANWRVPRGLPAQPGLRPD
jgi:hypothetical protein